MLKIQPIQPAKISFVDGRPVSDIFNDTYFSSVGAIKEKTHVFLKGNDLEARFNKLDEYDSFVIAELGFGLGINFLLAHQLWHKCAPKTAHLHFISTEINPVSKDGLEKILYNFPEVAEEAKKLIEIYPSLVPGVHRLHFANVTLTLMLGDALNCLSSLVCDQEPSLQAQLKNYSVNVWFLDGFSPSKNPCLWQKKLFEVMNLLSDTNTTLTTYSVSRAVKDNLEQCGFTFIKQPGIGQKKEFLFSTKIHELKQKGKYNHLASPWHCMQNPVKLLPNHQVCVVGAGLAGCILSYRLAERGIKVTLLEKEGEVATQASGNMLGMVHFNLSAFHSPLNDFMLSAFLYAIRFYTSLDDIELYEGIADLLSKSDFSKKQQQLSKFAQFYPEIIQILSAEELGQISDVSLADDGLFWPKALTVSPKDLCQKLNQHENIKLMKKTYHSSIEPDFDKVIFCGGIDSSKHACSQFLDLSPVPGMVSRIPYTKHSQKLKIALTKKGYITPANKHAQHVVGGSYHIENKDKAHSDNLDMVEAISPAFQSLQNQLPHFKQGVRAKTHNYLAYVGALPEEDKFVELYQGLAKDKKLRIKAIPPYSSKYYVLTGFGSHGLTTIPLSVECLLAQLFNEPFPISQSLIKAISPSRCLIKSFS